MKKIGCIPWLSKQQPSPAMVRRIAGATGIAIFLTMTGIAFAQTPTAAVPLPAPESKMSVPNGYAIHQSVDLGGHIANITGSNAMYDTLVNQQSGPRVLGESFTLRALPGTKAPLLDLLRATGSGFGGDPNEFAKLEFSKGKLYEFTGLFRRDRQYFDYDLLGNPNIPAGQSIPIGPSNAPTGSLAWPQVNQSPVMFNTVRRMTDTNLTIHPLSKLTYRFGYSQNIFQGPSLSPSYTIFKYQALLAEYQRNSTDDFLGAIDWKPIEGTKLTFEEQINHYKADSYFTLAPSSFIVQEADGTPVTLGNWTSLTPYGIAGCNTTSMGTAYTSATKYTILSAPQTSGGLPIINPACDVVSSYLRSQPTRVLTPTETLRLQSSSIRNISMNGDFNYTLANMNMPHYYENVQGLDGAIRSATLNGYAAAHRAVVAANYGVIWQATKTVSLSDQANYSSTQEPGYANLPIAATLSTPAAPNQTINYSGALTAGNALGLPHGNNGLLSYNYFGQEFLTNNLTASWDVTDRTVLSLTYRFSNHNIGQGVPHKGSIPLALGDPVAGTVAITENGGIFSAALHPVDHWDVNGSVEVLYDDNAFTPVGPRQTRHYRVHSLYKPKPWATFSGAFNDVERHNNTNNNQATIAAKLSPYDGPINHVDHSRVVSLGAVLAPNEHYGLDFDYAYSDIYTATNICFNNGASATLPGTATLNSSGTANVCATAIATPQTYTAWFGRDFMDAPTQFGSVAIALSPIKTLHSNVGYRVSSVNGSQFFTDARAVNGSLTSTYQTPFVNLAYNVRKGWIWKAEYNYSGYGEGGPSGPQLCSTSTSTTAAVIPCTSLTPLTGLTESPAGLTAPRNFHANNLTLGMHYEF